MQEWLRFGAFAALFIAATKPCAAIPVPMTENNGSLAYKFEAARTVLRRLEGQLGVEAGKAGGSDPFDAHHTPDRYAWFNFSNARPVMTFNNYRAPVVNTFSNVRAAVSNFHNYRPASRPTGTQTRWGKAFVPRVASRPGHGSPEARHETRTIAAPVHPALSAHASIGRPTTNGMHGGAAPNSNPRGSGYSGVAATPRNARGSIDERPPFGTRAPVPVHSGLRVGRLPGARPPGSGRPILAGHGLIYGAVPDPGFVTLGFIDPALLLPYVDPDDPDQIGDPDADPRMAQPTEAAQPLPGSDDEAVSSPDQPAPLAMASDTADPSASSKQQPVRSRSSNTSNQGLTLAYQPIGNTEKSAMPIAAVDGAEAATTELANAPARKRPDIDINALMSEANNAFKEKDFAGAIDTYQKIIDADSTSTAALASQANAYYAAKDYDKAADGFSRVLNKEPDLPLIYNNRGLSRMYAGNIDEALADFTKASSLQPNFAEAARNAGLAYARKGPEYNTKAVEEFSKAIELRPSLASAYASRADLSVRDHAVLAKKDYIEAIALSPRSAVLYRKLAALYVKERDLDLALSTVQKSIDLQPGNIDGLVLRGAVYATQGKNDLAVADYRAVLKADPKREKANQGLKALGATP